MRIPALILLIGTFTLTSCSADLAENYTNQRSDVLVGDNYQKEVETRVVNEWLSGTKRVVRVKAFNNLRNYSFSDFGDSVNIDEDYWGSLHPKTGHCVKVWANLRERKSKKEHVFELFGDRNLAPCKN